MDVDTNLTLIVKRYKIYQDKFHICIKFVDCRTGCWVMRIEDFTFVIGSKTFRIQIRTKLIFCLMIITDSGVKLMTKLNDRKTLTYTHTDTLSLYTQVCRDKLETGS